MTSRGKITSNHKPGKLSFHSLCHTLLACVVWFGLVWVYGISTIIGYLVSNLVYRYILNTLFVNYLLEKTCFKKPELLFARR